MFLTGLIRAGKINAVKAAEQFCVMFCRHTHIPWMESTYLYTVYTGSAAALFNGVKMFKKVRTKIKQNKPLLQDLIDGWKMSKLLSLMKYPF